MLAISPRDIASAAALVSFGFGMAALSSLLHQLL